MSQQSNDAESQRLIEERLRQQNWKRWGPYLAERQWGTVREDYSVDGSSWDAFPHDHARSRAYRWGEDGLLGICDREGRLCFALALWNERDPILKERLFGLTNTEGNHGEDVKECYFYLDSTPTHSYFKALYKYPQAEFPYAQLLEENQRRGRTEREYELLDTGIFDDHRYFDVSIEYAKAAPDDILIRIAIANRSSELARLHVLPTLWFKNTWSWGRTGEGYESKPHIELNNRGIVATHSTLGQFHFIAQPRSGQDSVKFLFTENETNVDRLFGTANASPYVKDAFHSYLIQNQQNAINLTSGTKAAAHYLLEVPPGETVLLKLRLSAESVDPDFGESFDQLFEQRIQEADEYYAVLSQNLAADEARVARQACAGLLWSKQFYHYGVADWLSGDPTQPSVQRDAHPNRDWANHLYNRDVISMPDKWEYPWYATWDLAFHMIPMAKIDPDFAKQQLILFLREWYMHPNGAIPAYEYGFSDTNPPVHAWACWRVYKLSAPRGERDRVFLARTFHKLLLNFTWWVNRKDSDGKNLFSGGFLGLDNIGLFDRSQPLPTGGELAQADATAWMAFYCGTMLSIAIELAAEDPAYEDVASKFFEHFIAIADAINTFGGTGLWNEQDGFYYDQIRLDDQDPIPLKVRSLVGLLPMLAVEVLEKSVIDRLPGFSKRMQWFLENRQDLAQRISCMHGDQGHDRLLLAIPSRDRLVCVLKYLLDEAEFLSPYGIRSVSRIHKDQPYSLWAGDQEYRVGYLPGESDSALFGGNSNWRGPIWFPINYLIIEALERYHYFYGDAFKVECPVGSGQWLTLAEVARELGDRLYRIFRSDESGHCPWQGESQQYVTLGWRDLTLFHEHFDGDTGRGLGASHQTGWTALIARLAFGNRVGIRLSSSR
ncbi:MGH1-like glycoside hydrolase domain-containing protein [Leptolyngbya sp. NIES-2104]|uniref:MGH1-like glycoside hydrolase domain-containing protein n=1 Tax=Leptolyngbya sp. NIES-2104 TaxID=1552121 RepID=UPI0006EC454B|nr:glucosidase [Leptolyngbya sp. NIES-2104]GAP96906.1 acyl-coenzyme A synthetase/AMP-(fatty) acid ligase [Leptolyngbya sp. NIES-2104]